jgi:hypothetical protein
LVCGLAVSLVMISRAGHGASAGRAGLGKLQATG